MFVILFCPKLEADKWWVSWINILYSMWLVLQPKICLEKLPECFYSHHQHQSLSSWTAWRINSIWGQRGEAKERHNGSIVSYYQKNSAEASKTVFVMSLDSATETGVRKPTKVVVSCMKNVMENVMENNIMFKLQHMHHEWFCKVRLFYVTFMK